MKLRHRILFAFTLGAVAIASYQLGAWRAASGGTVGATSAEQMSKTEPKATASGPASPAAGAAKVPWRAVKDPALRWEQRVEAVRKLPRPLETAALGELISFLHGPPGGKRSEWYVVCNEIMEVLRKRDLAPDTFTREMLALLRDPQADPVIRDYAVQTLAQWVAGLDANAGRERDPKNAHEALDVMIAEAQKPANGALTLAGTALQACADAVLNGSAEMRENRPKVLEASLAFASGKISASPVNRAAAIQVAARLGAEPLPEICRGILHEDSLSPDVRLSAIAALGQVGTPSDMKLLETLTRDPRFQYAADAAVKRLRQQ